METLMEVKHNNEAGRMGNFMKDVPDLDAFQNILGIYLKMKLEKCFILCCLVGILMKI